MSDKLDQLSNFDPNSVGITGNLFGLPLSPATANVVLLPVPWEVTVSYNGGTAKGPESILKASSQVDLYIKGLQDAWKLGIAMTPIPEQFEKENDKYRDMAIAYLNEMETKGFVDSEEGRVIPKAINEMSKKIGIYIESEAMDYLKDGKIVGLVGGDHSCPLGLMSALSRKYPNFGILQIDAHADLRKAYENFVYSHASIMYNAMRIKQITKLVQVGIRDICDEEISYINSNPEKLKVFFQEDIDSEIYSGSNWDKISDDIIDERPDNVYISFDIDGLDPKLCPNTGTPVPGGLEFNQAYHLIKKVVKSGRKIIGFDLSEVAPGETEWDANVGARMLYYLSSWAGASQGLLEFSH